MCYKEPVIRGVMRGNYIFRCEEWLEEIREISVLLRNPKWGGKQLAKGRRGEGVGATTVKLTQRILTVFTARLRVKMVIF